MDSRKLEDRLLTAGVVLTGILVLGGI